MGKNDGLYIGIGLLALLLVGTLALTSKQEEPPPPPPNDTVNEFISVTRPGDSFIVSYYDQVQKKIVEYYFGIGHPDQVIAFLNGGVTTGNLTENQRQSGLDQLQALSA